MRGGFKIVKPGPKVYIDQAGKQYYRVGDLPLNTKFKLTETGPEYLASNYPKSSYWGNRWCTNLSTNQDEPIKCSTKVRIST